MTTTIIALAGNPNVGKSTIFNALTGENQHVGNWPGKTVEKKEGYLTFNEAGEQHLLIDLPGTYSLSAYSTEEIISRDFILNQKPQTLIAVVDAANLERNLYLVLQLLELNIPLILVMNMSDIANQRGFHIDVPALSKRLGGIPIIQTAGNNSEGIEAIKQALKEPIAPHHFSMTYGELIEPYIGQLQALINSRIPAYDARWLAIKLLEDDEDIQQRLADYPDILQSAQHAINTMSQLTEDDAETIIADIRYQFINTIIKQTVKRPQSGTLTTSDKLDRIITHHIWGVPIFLTLMWLVFQFTANVSAPALDWVDMLISGPFTNWTQAILGLLGLSDTWVASLIIDGIIAGVGGVLVFVPILAFLYASIAILEETGYMARAAFVMDRFMNKLGLHGKSFLPMLVGFGCNVPGIYATRTLENELDRKITAFLTTFMSCGARLPVYVVFGAAFFGNRAGNLIFAMYATGILVAVLTSLMFTRIVYRNKPIPPFVIELPPYRVPAFRVMGRYIWDRVKEFIINAGTVILMASIILWILLAIPSNLNLANFNQTSMEDSLFGSVSKGVAPLFKPAGFGDWEASGSLITGLVAKEVVISTMNQIYTDTRTEPAEESAAFSDDLKNIITGFGDAVVLTVQETVNIAPNTVNMLPIVNIPQADFLNQAGDEVDNTALENALQNNFTPLSAVAFNVFVLLYIPCMATVGAMKHEFGNRWMLYQVGYTSVVAWVAATLVFQIGTLLGI